MIKPSNIVLTIVTILLFSVNSYADKHLFQITDIVNADYIIVNGENVHVDDIITEEYVWTWDDENEVIVYFTPLDGDDVGSTYVTSKKEMKGHDANTLSYINFAGKAVHELYDVFIINPGETIKLPIKAKEKTTYFVDEDTLKRLLIDDSVVYLPYDLLPLRTSNKKYLDTIKVYSSYYDVVNDNYEESIEGTYVIYKK